MDLPGGCSCGTLRYKLTASPLIVHACHCRDCQRLTGSAFVINLWIEKHFVEANSAAPQSFTLTGGSGQAHEVFFCGTCGTYVWSRYQAAPGDTLFVRAGTLDNPEAVKPQVHIFTRTKLPWLDLPNEVPAFEAVTSRSIQAKIVDVRSRDMHAFSHLTRVPVPRFMNGLLLCLFLTLALIPIKAEPQNQLSAEFKVLQKFVGVWDTQTRIRHTGPSPRQFTTSGRATCQQTLEGRYVEFRTQSIPLGQADLQVMTYDIEAGVYRQWLFDSDGYHHEAEGHWDPASSTLRWRGKTAATSFVIEDHWVSPDQLRWTLVRTDAQGQKLQTIEGTLIRVKES